MTLKSLYPHLAMFPQDFIVHSFLFNQIPMCKIQDVHEAFNEKTVCSQASPEGLGGCNYLKTHRKTTITAVPKILTEAFITLFPFAHLTVANHILSLS